KAASRSSPPRHGRRPRQAESMEHTPRFASVELVVSGTMKPVTAPIDYLNPRVPPGIARVQMPVVEATPATLQGYGHLVDDPGGCRIEIVRWPALGTRPVDAGTGDQGGTTEGVFVSEWRGDILYGRNEAVDGHYILAYAQAPEQARESHAERPRRMMLWHANYHPDGGQLFFPLERRPFYIPLALPGDDVTPERFVCFRFDGRHGFYIHPNIWHDGVFTSSGTQRFFDKQSAVHARVSVDFAREFGCLLEASLDPTAGLRQSGPEEGMGVASDREIVTTRLLDAPRERVFEAFRDPARLARWWGPKGFTNTFKEFDLRPGGVWRFVMHGPNGADYANHSVFVDVVKPERVVFDHVSKPQFQMTIALGDAGPGKTTITWRMRFETAAECNKIRGFP